MPIGINRGARISQISDSGGGDIHDYSVDYRYIAESYQSPWPDETDTADMTVSGLSESTFNNGSVSVSGDGSVDHGIADGPQSYGSLESFGIGFTLSTTDGAGNIAGANTGGTGNGDSALEIESGNAGPNGSIELFLQDSDNFDDRLWEYTDNSYNDGNVHAVFLNKTSDTNVDIFVDDVDSTVSSTTETNNFFNSSNVSIGASFGFYANNRGGSIKKNFAMDVGVFEFKPSPYSQTERQSFVDWRPEA